MTAFSIKVPLAIKRTLTTLQISQFFFGGTFAFMHSFVSYTIPVPEPAAEPAASSSASAAEEPAVLHTEPSYVTQQCITTDGATFAIWLNVLYLAPLTYLFVRFFITSYLRRGAAKRRLSNIQKAEKAGWEAARGVEKEVYGGVSEDAVEDEEVKVNGGAKANGRARR